MPPEIQGTNKKVGWRKREFSQGSWRAVCVLRESLRPSKTALQHFSVVGVCGLVFALLRGSRTDAMKITFRSDFGACIDGSVSVRQLKPLPAESWTLYSERVRRPCTKYFFSMYFRAACTNIYLSWSSPSAKKRYHDRFQH